MAEAIANKKLRVLVAGATGHLGRQVVQELKEQGMWVRALTRQRRTANELGADDVACCDIESGEGLATAFAGRIDVVFSCLGNSIKAEPTSDKASFWNVDYRLNKFLIERANYCGTRRFVYTSVFSTPDYRDTDYIKAHEATADYVRESGMEFGIMRPTSLFSSLVPYLDMAKRGKIVLIGDGETLINPIHDRDLARVCIEAITSDNQAQDIAAGGPDRMTRRELGEKAFAAVGQEPCFQHIPADVAKFMGFGPLVGLADKRLGELLDFYAKVNGANSVAPPIGKRTLSDFFAETVASGESFPARERMAWGGQNWTLGSAPARKR